MKITKKRKPNLPDNLIHANKGFRGSKKKEHQENFFNNLKEDEINPKGKEDFENALKAIIQHKGDFLE